MNTIKFNSKEAFMGALEGRRKFWRDYDLEQARTHKAAEQAWLKTAREKMRTALKLDYATLTTGLDYGRRLPLGEDTPKCPLLQEPKIDSLQRSLELTHGKTFVVGTEGAWSTAHWLLTADPRAPKSVC